MKRLTIAERKRMMAAFYAGGVKGVKFSSINISKQHSSKPKLADLSSSEINSPAASFLGTRSFLGTSHRKSLLKFQGL